MRKVHLLALVFGAGLIAGCPLVAPPASTCTSDADCDDGLFCNGTETCDTTAGTCEAGQAPCDAGAGETCNEGTDMCDTAFACTTDAECDDGLFCTGAETCDTATGTCSSAGDPCDASAGETCNEGTDTCDPAATDCTALTGDAAAGRTFMENDTCLTCHSDPPANLAGKDCTTVYDKLSGAVSHVGGTRTITEQDAADIAAYLAGL